MVRAYKRKTKRCLSYKDSLLSAIKEVKLHGCKVSTVAEAYQIPRRTLTRYLKKLNGVIPTFDGLSDRDLLAHINSLTYKTKTVSSLQIIFVYTLFKDDSFRFLQMSKKLRWLLILCNAAKYILVSA